MTNFLRDQCARVDVVSTDSGAHDPGCAGGVATTAKTYFHATFCTVCTGPPLDRLLSVDSALALSVASAQVPLRHQLLCIVNSSKYGGFGGAIYSNCIPIGPCRAVPCMITRRDAPIVPVCFVRSCGHFFRPKRST
jgi:hypothetical protein